MSIPMVLCFSAINSNNGRPTSPIPTTITSSFATAFSFQLVLHNKLFWRQQGINQPEIDLAMLLPVVHVRETCRIQSYFCCHLGITVEPQNLVCEIGCISWFEISNHPLIEIRFDGREPRDNGGYSQGRILEQFRWKHIVSKIVGGIRNNSDARLEKYFWQLLDRHRRYKLHERGQIQLRRQRVQAPDTRA